MEDGQGCFKNIYVEMFWEKNQHICSTKILLSTA